MRNRPSSTRCSCELIMLYVSVISASRVHRNANGCPLIPLVRPPTGAPFAFFTVTVNRSKRSSDSGGLLSTYARTVSSCDLWHCRIVLRDITFTLPSRCSNGRVGQHQIFEAIRKAMPRRYPPRSCLNSVCVCRCPHVIERLCARFHLRRS